MTDERQAVKTLAEELVKAMKSVSANTPSRNYTGATTPGTIQASKIIGLPAAFSSIISGVESSAAGGDAIAQQTLVALNHIAAGEFETITADTANIEKLYATFGDFITLVAEDATIGDLDVETIRAGLAEVGLLNIGTASIDMAQIVRSSTQTAFIHESVQGKVYIDDLAVNDASIVNLSAGTVLINDNSGNLVELYVDEHGNVNTRAVAYDGSDIINQNSLSGNTIINNTLSGDAVITNSLSGNKIISNSITTTQLNANEIFAYQGTIMDLIADNIEATRLFANQGFITELQSTIISSDLSQNTSFIELTDSINLVAANSSRTFIQENMPIPVHTSDTWFDPTTEEHYVANAVYLPISQMVFGHDEEGNLRNDHSEDYRFTINSDGELMLLVTNEEASEIIVDNDIDFEVIDDHVQAGGLWRKVDNVAFSNLKVSVDGIVSEVYDSQTGTSRIEQNAGQIMAIVTGDTAVPYVETSSVKILEDKIEVKSTGDVDIKASNFSISFNTDGTLTNKSRVDISDSVGIKVSDSYGNYFQATSSKIGLYDIQNNPKLYMDSNGHAFFNGSLTLGGANNTNGSLTVRNGSGNVIISADNTGLEVYNSTGATRQFYIDSPTGNATFAGALNAATGSFAGSLSAATGTFAGSLSAATGSFAGSLSAATGTFAGSLSAATGTFNGSLTLGGSTNGSMTIKNVGGTTIGSWSSSGIEVYNSTGATRQFYIDSSTGNATFAGSLSAATGTFAGSLSAATGTFTGTMSANSIVGGTLILGGTNNGALELKDQSNDTFFEISREGFELNNHFSIISTENDIYNSSIFKMKFATYPWDGTVEMSSDGFIISIIYSETQSRYIKFGFNTYYDSNNVRRVANMPLTVQDDMDFVNGNKSTVIGDGYLQIMTKEDYEDPHTYFDVTGYVTDLYCEQSYLYLGNDIHRAYMFIQGDAEVTGDLSVSGTKSRIVSTDQYSDRLLYCYETPSPLFGDVGEGVISSDGQCYISLDPIFAQTISTDQYQVFLQPYGEGDCYVSERRGSYFIVAGTPNLPFGWELKAKQSDFDQLRLERNDEKFTIPTQTYGEDAAEHMKELYNERIQQGNQESEE